MQVNFFTFKKENFICPKCGWVGNGRELLNGEFSEAHLIQDLDCPVCYEHIGFWQAPLKEEVQLSMKGDINLYHLDTGSDKSDIHLRFESDALVLDGYDRGPLTKQLTDDYDYEYMITVAVSQLLPLYNRFGLQMDQRQELLEHIGEEVSGPQAYTLFQKMLSAAGVTFTTWSA